MTRAVLALACGVFFVLCVLGMRRGWVNRCRRQSDLAPLPDVPSDLGAVVLGPLSGLYVGSTSAGRWQDRVVARGLGIRADATATLAANGLLIERAGCDALFVPAGDIVKAGVGAGLAGKVLGPGGLLIVRWRLGGAELDTGFRADDKSVYADWVNAIDELGVTA